MTRLRSMLLLFTMIALLVAAGIMAQEFSDEETEMLEFLTERGVAVRAVEDVLEDGPQLDEVSPDSANVSFVTTVPLACSIVYGETTDFGQMSLDLDMGGSAHTDHHPAPLDLKPDTEYFYRLQGTAEDGTLYISQIYSFRTPPASDEVTDNLLSPDRGAEVTGVSSNFGGQPNDGTWGILNAFDDNGGTAWSTDGDGDDAWFEVALGERTHINRMTFQTRSMTDGTSQILAFTITTDDGTEYGPFEAPDPEELYEYEVDFEASTLRFDAVETSGGNTGITEMAVFGEPVGE